MQTESNADRGAIPRRRFNLADQEVFSQHRGFYNALVHSACDLSCCNVKSIDVMAYKRAYSLEGWKVLESQFGFSKLSLNCVDSSSIL